MTPHTPSGGEHLLRGVSGLVLGGGLVAATATPAAAAVSQNGWSAGSSVPLTKLAVVAAEFAPGVRSGNVHTILGYVAGRFNSEVETLVRGWCWGYAYRPISGSTIYSNHASGTAIDCNAPDHPLGVAYTFTAAQVASIRAILAACDGVIRWGGHYSGRKDDMHFEINVGPGSAAVPVLAAKLGGAAPPPPPPSGGGWPVVRRGNSGYRVTTIQRLLRQHGCTLTVDGDYGPATESAVGAFQASRGLASDGIVGSNTWVALVVTVRQGSQGEAVRGAQSALNAKGSSLTADGVFGSGTHDAVTVFQQARGLAADGIVGDKTWSALMV